MRAFFERPRGEAPNTSLTLEGTPPVRKTKSQTMNDPKTDTDTEAAARWAVARARALGADQAAAEVSADRGLAVAVREGETESVEYTDERVMTVSVWCRAAGGMRRGAASTSDLSEAAMERTVRAAVEIARCAAPDPAAGLPDEETLQTDFRDLDLWHPFEGGVAGGVELARRAEAAAFDADHRIVTTEGARFQTSEGGFTLANSWGFSAGYRYARHELSLSPIAEDASGMEREDDWTEARRVEDLLSPERLGARAAARAAARLGAQSLANGDVRVLFEARTATGLLDILEELLSGRALYRKASCLLGREGNLIFPRHVNVEEDPYLPASIGSGLFDNEGCAGTRRLVVEEGRLAGAFLTSYSARRLGRRTTGNAGGAYNLRLTSAETRASDTFDVMLARLGTGLLVTEVFGHGVNPVTGDYSRGASGFWVENGRLAYPVAGVTLAGNLLDMMASVEAVGADEHPEGARRTGSLLLPKMTVAGG